ncbi:MAG: glutamate--tRNA ligase [Dehalococcoidia bacterium]|nr:MAG: glutamate--tRNA ligase [Dehalococcoidia bacterium]
MDNTSEQVRVRFAPSPTGYPHLGNIRTALFNWLYARHSNGVFILRIEDTDQARKVEGAVEIIIDSLKWLGLDFDEGPVFQSERLDMYRKYADQLVDEGKAYRCFCSSERLESMRQDQVARKQPPGYDRRCRELTAEQIQEAKAQGIVPVVRFKSPLEGQTAITDLIRGEVTFDNKTLDDFVLLKSDGYPTYHLANIVDDHFMKITHVMRAEEWLSSAPRHLLLYRAFGWQPPHFAHLPMILGPDKSKLSKRHGATAINEYRDKGYLPEAMINFLTLLGWSLDDKTEIMTIEEIIKNFSIERVSKTAAVFNIDKLEWMNGMYIRNLSADDFAAKCLPFVERDLPAEIRRPIEINYLKQIAPLIQERARTLGEVAGLIDFFYVDNLEYDAALLQGKLEKSQALIVLQKSIAVLEGASEWKTEPMEHSVRPLTEEVGLKAGPFFGVLRVAITGRTASPPLFQTMEVLGRQCCMDRLQKALKKLS